MTARIRGQEATVRITVADAYAASFGIYGQLQGSFFKVRDFTLTARSDMPEESFLGEKFDDFDFQHHGFDFNFTIDDSDPAALNFMSLICYKEELSLPPPIVGVSVSYIYRDPGVPPYTEKLIDCLMRQTDRSIGGRKEYIQNSFEGKAKQRRVFVG